MIQKAIVEIIVLDFEISAIKIILAEDFVFTIINIDRDDINIEITWIKRGSAIAWWVAKVELGIWCPDIIMFIVQPY